MFSLNIFSAPVTNPTLTSKKSEIVFPVRISSQKEIVLLKQTAAKELGFLYEIWVYDNKGNKVEFYD